MLATNNAIDKATALAKIADLISVCNRSMDSASKFLQTLDKQSAQPKEEKEVEDIFGDIQ